MKKLILVFGVLVLLVGVVSADLCRGNDGYYHDCRGVSFEDNKKVVVEYESEWEDYSDRYRQCLRDCDYRYKRYCCGSRNEKCSLRKECYDSCTERRSYSERVEYSESIQDLRDSYRESYDYRVEIEDSIDSLWREDRSEIIYLDKYEYEYERPYFSRDSAVVYVNPYRGYTDNVIYLDGSGKRYKGSGYDFNRAGYGYKYTDNSLWRYKEDYVWSDYQDCYCEEWSWGRCQEWECDDNWNNYYYKPRQMFGGGFEWGW